MPIIEDTSEADFFTPQPGYIFVMGPPGAGKTIAGARVSQHFPHERLKLRGAALHGLPKVVLEDTLHLAWDLGAGSGLSTFGVEIPTLNMRAVCEKYGPVFAWKEVADLFAKAKARFPEVKEILIDTVSALDDVMAAWWHEHMPKSDKGADNTQQMWTGLAASHTHWREKMTVAAMEGFKARPIVLSHAVPKFQGQGDRAVVAKAKMEAENVVEGDMIPAITGKSAGAWVKHADMVLWCDFEESLTGPLAGKPEGRSYYFYGHKQGVACKNRFAAVTGDRWEADMGLTFETIGRRPKRA